MAETDITYVRDTMAESRPAPAISTGVLGWLRTNLFSSWLNTAFTLLGVYLLYAIIAPLVNFAFVDAVWTGDDRSACATVNQAGGVRPEGWFGACWAYVDAYGAQFIYGRYPIAERWRVDLVFILFAIGLVPMMIPSVPFKRENIIYMLLIFPVAAMILLTGGHFQYTGFLLPDSVMAPGATRFAVDYLIVTLVFVGAAFGLSAATQTNPLPAVITVGGIFAVFAVVLIALAIDFGLEEVETDAWGGLLVTLVIAVSGIAASLPIGIAFALGRRSNLPAIRLVSVIFIEFWRGVPLITVLFMASVMLPLFLPEGVNFDKLLRVLIGIALFSAAYMAEVVRGGLQAIPKGQYEGAQALGLTYWQMMGLIILPQALKLVIPGIVNTFIGLFKDTTLVLIIGLFDFLGQIQSSFSDPKWQSAVQALTGYLYAAVVYWFFCFAMSRYSIFMEKRLHTGHKR